MKYIKVVQDADKRRIIKQMCKENTFMECKVLGYQEFIKKFYFDYDKKAIYYLAETYNTTKEIAEIYLKNMYLLNETAKENDKIEFLKKLYQDLKKHHLILENPLWKEQIKKTKIVFYHITRQDLFFQKLVKDVKKKTLVEIHKKEIKEKQEISLIEYEDMEQEVIGVMNQICNHLKKGIAISNIFLTNLNEEYRILLKCYSKIFHIPFQLKESDNYLSNEIVYTFLHSKKSIKETIIELKEIYNTTEEKEIIKKIIDISNQYLFIKDDTKKRIWIREELKKQTPKEDKEENSIKEISFLEEEIEEDSILYVLGVKEGNFPTINKEEQFFTDAELSSLQWETTQEKNELEKLCYQTKLKTLSTIFFSYPKQDGKIKNRVSCVLNDYLILKNHNEEWSHSNLYNQLMLASKMDYFKKYGAKDSTYPLLKSTYKTLPYCTYNNQWQPFLVQPSISFSYSLIDAFFHCPFRFYLTYLLKIKKEKNDYDLKIGNFCHVLLKESYEKNFDFEESFKKHSQELQLSSPKENFFLNKRKEDLKRILKVLKNQEKEKDLEILSEKKITLEIENVSFSGILDKIYLKKHNDKTLISVIDYKTGNPDVTFDNLIYGLNLQLPIYLLLLKQLPYKNLKIIGLYLQKIIPSIPIHDKIHTEEELLEKKLMLQGYSTDEENILKTFDPTYENSKLIQGLKMSSKGFYPYSKVLKEEEFEIIEQITLEKIKEAIAKIKNSSFWIHPLKINNQVIGCEYCPYQEICYRKEENMKCVKEVKQKEMLGGK